MEIAQSPQYMDIVQFIIDYIRENRKYIPPADFLFDYPEQLKKNYAILLSTLDGPNYGLWLSELHLEALSMGLKVTNDYIIEALSYIRKEKDNIINYTKLFIDVLRWCDRWTNPSYNISDYDQTIANMQIGHVVGQIMRLTQSPPPAIPADIHPQQDKKGKKLANGANLATIGSFILAGIFGIAAMLPNQQITEQNQILTGIWQEMQEYNDSHAPTPTPDCTPDLAEQWLST